MITGITEVTQDPEKAGNALKVLSLRLRGMKGQLEELGEETDENVENISKMQGQILNMTKGKVNIFDATGNFKSTYEIMQGIAEVWDDLSSIDQADLLETIAGKHRANDIASLLANWQNVEAAVKSASEAEGSAARENAKYIDSIQGRLDKLTTAWQSFANTFMESDFLKGAISGLTGLVEVIERLVKSLGTFGTIGLGAGIFSMFKSKGLFKGILGDLGSFGQLAAEAWLSGGKLSTRFKDIGKTAKMAGSSIAGRFTGSLSGMIGGIGLAVAAIGLLVNAYIDHKEAAAAARQEAIETADAFLEASDSFEQAYIKYSGKTNLTVEEENELKTAIDGTVDALGDKSNKLKGVVNASKDYVASLEAIKDAELQAAKDAADDKRNKAAESLKEVAFGWETVDGSEVDVDVVIASNPEQTEIGKIAKEVGEKFFGKDDASFMGQTVDTGAFTLSTDASIEEILEYYNMLVEFQGRLEEEELTDTVAYTNTKSAIDKMSESIEVYTSSVYDAVKANHLFNNNIPKTTEEYIAMREAILSDVQLDDFSPNQKMIILNDLDSQYGKSFNLSSAEVQARKFVGIIKGYGDGTVDDTDEIGTVETFLNMRTAVNNNECTVGEYLSELDNVTSMSENFSDEERKEFNLAYGLDTDSIKKQYDDLYDYLKRNYIDTISPHDYSIGKKATLDGMRMWKYAKEVETTRIKDLLDSLSATELEAALSIRTEIDWGNATNESIMAQIKEEAKFIEAMNYTIAIDVETESLDALNSALSESVSATGLSSESIAALKDRYAELASQGYDLSSMFEETSNGIHLNKNAISEFEQALASKKLSETDSQLEILKGRYDDLTKEIETCTDAGERASLYSDQQEVAQKINDLATLASQYKGLASAYNAWQNVESAGSERDMYESIIEGFETVGDEIKRGWYDDGTIKFLELITGQTDLAGKSASELKKIWNSLDDTIKGTSYSVKDFFTVDEDGNSTSTGAYNFLRAIEELGKNGGLKALKGKNIEDLIVRNDKGKIVEFDFDVVGGDAAIAKALGISEEMVQIMQRTLDDAGFVVTLDGKYTLLADLKTSAEEANNALKKLKSEGVENLKDVDLNFDFNVDTVEGYQEQLEKALNVLDKFRNKDGTLQTDKNGNLVEGAKQALEIAEYYTAAMDKLTEPKFMQIDTSTVDKELQDPIEKMQTIGDLCKEKHLVSLTGDTEDLKEVQGEIDKVAKEIEELDPEVKAQIGIDEDWDAKTIADKIEKGEIEIPAELKLDVQMSEDLKDIRLLMMRQLGLVDDNEVKLKIGYDIDDSTVDKLIKDGKEEVVIEFITKNEEWFDKLTDDKKKIIIDLVSSGVDLSKLEDEKKKVVVEYIEKDAEWFNKLDDEEKKVVVNYVAEHGEIDDWSPEAKEAFVKYLVDGGDPDKFDPDNKESWVVYKKDSTEPDSYAPRNPNALVRYGKDSSVPDSYDPDDPDATVVYNKNSLIPDNYIPLDPPATVIFDKDTSAIDSYDPPDFVRTVTYNIKEVAAGGKKKAAQRTGADPDGSGVNGTANVNGTTGRAFKQGSWGTKNSGTALVGELGREVLVRDGKYYTIGDNGAEFIKYKKGDIIFNHVQSEQLFANGKVTADGGRAKALVNGTAFVGGIYPTSGAAFSGTGGGEYPTVPSFTVGYVYGNKDTDKNQEIFDWIEVAIKRIEREIDNLDQKVGNVYKSWSSRNEALASEINKVSEEIALQKSAAQGYLNAANEIGLSSGWKKKVQSGDVDIDNITDETLAEKIKDYQKYYELYLDCIDAVEELKETEASLYAQRFENVQSQYDGILQGYEHTESMLNEYISQAEAKGQIVSKNYYNSLISNEKSRIAKLKEEQADLIKARDEAVANNEFDKYSEDWHRMCAEIDSVTQAIEEGTTSIIEYNNAIRDIEWEKFDLIQQRITDVTDEADFLIELMSNKKLYEDDGKLTSQGLATMGLHGQNYNTYMYQSDDYAKEIAKIDKQLAKGYSKELEDRRRELIGLHRDMILAAEDEKNAIRDMVEEGINLELDALQEKIDLYNEALESQKDLYDYQKRVEEQTKNIASLQKQLSAYEGDNSEEAKAKIQELKISLEEAEADLEETQYDKYIADQSALLDNLYEQYSETLNTRLDNVDALLEQVIKGINLATGTEGTLTSALGSEGAIALALSSNATSIGQTLKTEASNVGTTLSNAMNNIWNTGEGNAKSVLEMYGNGFQSKQTTTNTELSFIKSGVNSLVSAANKEAEKKVTANTTTTSAKKNPTTTTNKNNSNTISNTSSNTNAKTITDNTLKSIAAAIWVYGSKAGWEDDPTRKNKLSTKLGATNAKKVQEYINKYGTSGELYKHWYNNNLKLSSYSYSAFKLGARKIDESQLAWTQENGQEYIVRPSDGAILTPVAKGDSVLTSAATNNIWQMANNPAEFIKDNLNLSGASVPNNSTVQSNYTQYLDNVTFSFPNVHSYEEMLAAMQKDRNFERLITSMSIDRLAGKSSLAKGKAIR